MMRKLFFYTFISLSTISFSCNPCSNLDCLTNNYYGQFRIVSKADGKDLVFGQSRVYDASKIRFYILNSNDTILFDYKPVKFPGNGYDSILYVNFYPQTNKPVYMKLNNSDIDTLELNYNTINTKCCGSITEITKFRYNNSMDIPGKEGTQEIKK